jgi:hypothetical protein
MSAGARGARPARGGGELRRRARWGLAAALAVNVLVAWFPYRFDPPHPTANGARVDGRLVTVDGDAVAHTRRPPAWLGTARRTGRFWLTLEARSLDDDQPGPVRVVAIESGYVQADVMVGQHHDDMTVSVRRPDADTAGNPPVYLHDVFADDDWHTVEVTGTPDEVVVVVDGGPRISHRMTVPGAYRAWETSYRLHVGDSPTGNRPWHGEVRRLEAGSGTIREDYLAPGVLEVPDRIWYVPERLDDPLGWRSDKERADELAVVHFLSFVPVGLLLAAGWRGRRRGGRGDRAVIAHLAAGLEIVGLACVVQAGKVLFDARHPAVVDLAAQAAGGLAGYGLWLAHVARARRRRGVAGRSPAAGTGAEVGSSPERRSLPAPPAEPAGDTAGVVRNS